MRSRLSTRTASIRVMAASLAAAGVIFGGLAVQMANGHDPALGAGTSSARSSGSGSASTSTYQDQSAGSSVSGVVTRAS
jgi:hypothetical protein